MTVAFSWLFIFIHHHFPETALRMFRLQAELVAKLTA